VKKRGKERAGKIYLSDKEAGEKKVKERAIEILGWERDKNS
jgi:hypothetical protein